MYGKDRNLLIDCIRGFSILLVIATHATPASLAKLGRPKSPVVNPT
jgi:hypothetical protein